MVVIRGPRIIRENDTIDSFNLKIVEFFIYLETRINVMDDVKEC